MWSPRSFGPGSSLRDKLQALEGLVNIELKSQRLNLDQLGTLGDVAYLHHLIDLLCDLADEVEQRRYGKLSPVIRNKVTVAVLIYLET